MKRYDSIDLLRAVAIFLMVLCHFVIFTSTGDKYPLIYFFCNHVFGDLAAPLFAFILGMSLCVSVMNWKARGASDSFIVRRSLIRGVILFIIGLLYLLFIWGPGDIFDWDVLTMLGCSVIFLTTLRKQKPVVLVLIGLLIIISSPLLRDLLDYPRFWDFETDEFSPPFTLKEVFCGFFLNGYFPIFPWIAYSLFGYAVSKRVLFNESRRLNNQTLLPLIGSFLIIFGFGGAIFRESGQIKKPVALYLSELSFYPLTTTLFAIELGICLVLFWYFYVRLDLQKGDRKWLSFFRRYSRYSLSIYVIHHILIVLIPRILGWLKFGDDYYYYKNLFSPPTGLALAAVFIVAFYPILVLWDRVHGKFSLEWLVKRFMPKWPEDNTY